MTLARFDLRTPEHPKLLALHERERWRWFALVLWCLKTGTDGQFAAREVHRANVTPSARETRRLVAELRRVRLLELVDGDPDDLEAVWQLHDFTDYQPSAETVRKRRDKTARRVKRHRQRRQPPQRRNGMADAGSLLEGLGP